MTLTLKIRFTRATIAAGICLTAFVPVRAEAATRIKFPKGSYCGNYSGNYRSGRQFVLGLAEGQRFVVRNTGVGNQTNWSVKGPYGELEGSRVDRATLEYYTEADGDHYVYISSTVRRSSVQFCAY